MQRLHERHGRTFRLRSTEYVTNDPDMFEWVLTSPDWKKDVYADPFYNILQPVWGEGLVTSEGEAWASDHRLLMRTYQQTMLTAQKSDERIAALVTLWGEKQPSGLLEACSVVGHTLLTDFLFGSPVISEVVTDALHSVWELVLHTGDADDRQVQRMAAQMKERMGVADTVLRHAIASASPRSFVGNMQPHDRSLDNVKTLLFSGRKNVAFTLAWAFSLLAAHPHYWHSIGSSPQNEPVAKSALQESLRLYPIYAGLGRTSTADTDWRGHTYPAGSQVILNVWSLHRNADVFPYSNQFQPDRWSEKPLTSKYSYLPFGAGPRACLFQAWAWDALAQCVAAVCREYSPTYTHRMPVASMTVGGIHPPLSHTLSLARV